MNYNPFFTKLGNGPDCSGRFPGEPRYKDPSRESPSYASSIIEREYIENMENNPGPKEATNAKGNDLSVLL